MKELGLTAAEIARYLGVSTKEWVEDVKVEKKQKNKETFENIIWNF